MGIKQIKYESLPVVVDVDGLADYLHISKDTVLKIWRKFPYFFISNGNTAKSARFIISDVVRYLRQNGENYGDMEGRDGPLCGPVDVQVSVPGAPVQKAGIQDSKGRRKGKKRASAGTSGPENDKYGILRAV
ncbi:hypothetical protein [Desulfococcus multivorans]|jgi:hypothetical protein|uniref:hypothetical protein n=1 Tax=Desulfococcus multivorans TaxID=897 RepID=UPI0013563E20|nr:hypothetical protein [Desulfococcus multivorans]MDX9818219.1 hypothetical protein [Desulfococcus multivorans]